MKIRYSKGAKENKGNEMTQINTNDVPPRFLSENPPEKETEDKSSLDARLVALELLSQILDRKQSLDVILENLNSFSVLDVRDRAFARMLVSTTLRRLGQIDDLIARAQDRPESLKMPAVRNILRLGTTQLFFMDVPDHASVDTSVRLAEAVGVERQKGFINAILREMTRKGSEWIKAQDVSRLNTPEWLLDIWIADYGLSQTLEIVAAHLAEAPLDISVKNQDQKQKWARDLMGTIMPTGSIRRMSGGNIRDLEGFDAGEWWIQDAAAAIPVTLMGTLEGMRVVDLCAAPGGKTLQLASMGAFVTAVDRSAKRLKKLEENLTRTGLNHLVDIAVSDASVWTPKEPPQKILIDAPCSATGTIRRHPDTPHLKTPKDIQSLMAIQEKLLDHSAEILAVGGLLLYCTCSLQKDEGERQIENFLKKHKNIERLPIFAEEVGGHKEFINEHGDLRLLPCHLPMQGGLDGFFISRLTKKS